MINSGKYPKGWYGKIATALAYNLNRSETYIRMVARGEVDNQEVYNKVLEYCEAHNAISKNIKPTE